MTPDGQVLAMVGGESYQNSQFNRVTKAYRQPGSAFKFFIYLTALENGYSPEDIRLDEEAKYKKWSPKNWDNKYIGPVSLRNALSKSINTVAVKLTKELGIDQVISTAHKLGITSTVNRDLSSALGTSELNLLELTGAYAHMANYGNSVWVHGITEIVGDDGQIIYKRNSSGQTRVITTKATAQMNDMLMNVVEFGTGKNARMDRQAAGKTGTSQDYRDAWFIGYTQDYVTGVWVGNDDNSHMKKVAGGGVPVDIWKEFMINASEGLPSRPIPISEYVVEKGKEEAGFLESIFGEIY
jgi:penicillin-binding protein 1A